MTSHRRGRWGGPASARPPADIDTSREPPSAGTGFEHLARLLAALGVFFALCGCGAGDGDRKRPNLVLIIIDTLRADRLGAYGFGSDASPELDTYARRGVRFASVFASSSWTRPSVGALLTSLYPRTLGIYDEEGHALNENFTTLPEVLREHGYWTLGATANPNINSSFNFDQGFDHYIDSNVLWEWMPKEPGKKLETEQALHSGVEIYQALEAQLSRVEHRPFYAQVTVMEVHEASREYAAGSDPADPAAEEAEPPPEETERRYFEAVRQASREAHAFIRRLSALTQGEQTLFVVTSDHGEGLSDHPHVGRSRRHGPLLYESQLRVPLILYSTAGDLPAGRVIETPVRLLDLMPTILDYAAVPAPDGVEGRSLLPLLRDEDAVVDLPETFVAETRFRRYNKIAAYGEKWKYIENRDDHRGTLPRALHRMGVKEDGRRTDLAPGYAAVANRFASWVRAWEEAHPRAAPTAPDAPLSDSEIAQLESMGYGQ
jgi:arylsulfatase A-like enzyme